MDSKRHYLSYLNLKSIKLVVQHLEWRHFLKKNCGTYVLLMWKVQLCITSLPSAKEARGGVFIVRPSCGVDNDADTEEEKTVTPAARWDIFSNSGESVGRLTTANILTSALRCVWFFLLPEFCPRAGPFWARASPSRTRRGSEHPWKPSPTRPTDRRRHQILTLTLWRQCKVICIWVFVICLLFWAKKIRVTEVGSLKPFWLQFEESILGTKASKISVD